MNLVAESNWKYSQVTSAFLFPRDIGFPHSLYFCVWVEPGDPWTNRIHSYPLQSLTLVLLIEIWNLRHFMPLLIYYLYILFSFRFLCRCVREFVYRLKTIMFSSILKRYVLYHVDLQICAYIFAIIIFSWWIDSFRQESNVSYCGWKVGQTEAELGFYIRVIGRWIWEKWFSVY